MELRILGATGIRVSPIGLGTVKLGRREGLKYPNAFELPDDLAVAELLDAAQNCGVNLLDTAPAYGTSEERLGRLLRGQRERWTIVTKAGEEFEGGRSRFDFSPAAIRASVERSLTRLRTDRVEVLLIHSDGVVEAGLVESGVIGVMGALKSEGKIRAYGVSTKTPEGAMRAVETCDAVMVTLNPDYMADLPAIATARERGVGVLVKKALGSGHLVSGAAPRSLEETLRVSLTCPGVSSVILGTVSPGHLRENCQSSARILSGRA